VLFLSTFIHTVSPHLSPVSPTNSLLPTLTARVPRLKNSGYRLFGLNISEKSWTYLLAGQLLIGGGLHTAAPACCGLLAGYMYDQDYCSIQKFRFPRFVEVTFSYKSPSLTVHSSDSLQRCCPSWKFYSGFNFYLMHFISTSSISFSCCGSTYLLFSTSFSEHIQFLRRAVCVSHACCSSKDGTGWG
jgi:hypothetical protein